MFSGIVESLGEIIEIESLESNLHLWVKSPFHNEVKVDQSIAHNGICLTVDQIENDIYRVTAIAETIEKTSISGWKIGNKVNLERCLRLGDRLDGHIVQGHVDSVAKCISAETNSGSWEFQFQIDKKYSHLIIEKGSICLDGTSLTCHSLTEDTFRVSIIPYTYEHTIAHSWCVNMKVNIEFDILGKYLARQNNS